MSHENLSLSGRLEPEGRTFDAHPNQSLLDAMEKGGLHWPSSCRVGSCRTCMGTLFAGQVRYEMEWPGVTPEEKQAGYILPCVAYPVTHVVLRHPFSD